MRTRRVRRYVVAIAAVGFLATACGDDSGPPAFTGTLAPTTTTTAPTTTTAAD